MNRQKQARLAIQQFITGGDTNDATLLEKVLHEKFQNIQDGFFEQQGIFIFSKSEYIQLVATRKFGGHPRTIQIEHMEDLGNIAIAKVLLESRLLRFESYITVVKQRDAWQVISNIPKITIRQVTTQDIASV